MKNRMVSLVILDVSFLLVGAYLVVNGHPDAGGWLIFGAIIGAFAIIEDTR